MVGIRQGEKIVCLPPGRLVAPRWQSTLSLRETRPGGRREVAAL